MASSAFRENWLPHLLPIRIAFVDSQPILLRGLADLFSEIDRFEIVGTGRSAADAVKLAAAASPEVLVLDLSVPGDVFAAIEAVRDRPHAIKIVIFSAHADVDTAIRVFDAGAHALVLKGRPTDDLLAAIDAAVAGTMFVSPDMAPKLMGALQSRAHRPATRPENKLSARELQLVNCLFEGMTNKEIARELTLSEKTVKHYMTNLMNKLKVKSRLEVILAVQQLRRGSEA